MCILFWFLGLRTGVGVRNKDLVTFPSFGRSGFFIGYIHPRARTLVLTRDPWRGLLLCIRALLV